MRILENIIEFSPLSIKGRKASQELIEEMEKITQAKKR
jgi:hypothetical protein